MKNIETYYFTEFILQYVSCGMAAVFLIYETACHIIQSVRIKWAAKKGKRGKNGIRRTH